MCGILPRATAKLRTDAVHTYRGPWGGGGAKGEKRKARAQQTIARIETSQHTREGERPDDGSIAVSIGRGPGLVALSIHICGKYVSMSYRERKERCETHRRTSPSRAS